MKLSGNTQNGLVWVLGIALVVISLALTTGFVYILFNIAKSIPYATDLTFIIAIFAAFFSFMANIILKYIDKKQRELEELRMKKRDIYFEYVHFWFDMYASTHKVMSKSLEKTFDQKDYFEFITDFFPKIVLWGSDDILKLVGDYQQTAFRGTQNQNDQIKKVEEIIFAMRKDLGHKNKGIKAGDMWRLVVTDIDNVFPQP